jgi:lysophospholipase L1-like esterase
MRSFRVLNGFLMAFPCLAFACQAADDGNGQTQTTSGVSATTTDTAPTSLPTAPPTTSTAPAPVVPPVTPPTVQPQTPPSVTPAPVTMPEPTSTGPGTGSEATSEEVSETVSEPAASASVEIVSSAPGATSDEPAPGGFQPCKSNPCVILPLGDSITDGVGVDGGGSYRIELFSLALADDKAITYVGGLTNGPQMVDGVTFPRSHEGHSGWTVQQIDDLLFKNAPPVAISSNPEIVLLHLGTNDMWNGPDGAPDRLGKLVDKLIDALPESLIAVSTIIPWPQNAGLVDTYNAGVVTEVNKRIDAGEHVIFVDQFKDYPENELADGIHPNARGYEVMAGKWYEAISEYLPTAQ